MTGLRTAETQIDSGDRLLYLFSAANSMQTGEALRLGDEINDELELLAAVASREFLARSVRVEASDSDTAITAQYYSKKGSQGYRPMPRGVLMRPNPDSAVGRITKVDLIEGTLQVRPRWFSLYRGDRGLFMINVLSSSGEPQVNVKLLDAI